MASHKGSKGSEIERMERFANLVYEAVCLVGGYILLKWFSPEKEHVQDVKKSK